MEDFKGLNSSSIDLMYHPPLEHPRSHASALLLSNIDYLSRYLLLVTNAGPVFWDSEGSSSWQRQFVGEVLHLTGSYTTDEEVDRVCKAIARQLAGKTFGSAGLRLSREERAQVKAWHAKQGFA